MPRSAFERITFADLHELMASCTLELVENPTLEQWLCRTVVPDDLVGMDVCSAPGCRVLVLIGERCCSRHGGP